MSDRQPCISPKIGKRATFKHAVVGDETSAVEVVLGQKRNAHILILTGSDKVGLQRREPTAGVNTCGVQGSILLFFIIFFLGPILPNLAVNRVAEERHVKRADAIWLHGIQKLVEAEKRID